MSAGPALGVDNAGTVPVFRGKMGMYNLTTSAGSRLKSEPLGALVTLQPTLLWDLPTFKSRIGVHFIADVGSSFGMMPISGIGFSGYFYLFGLSTSHETDQNGNLFQKSRPGPFVVGTLTPVNFNLNRKKEQNADGNDLTFNAVLFEVGLGVGYDFPLRQNLILSAELGFRTAGGQQSSSTDSIEYSGIGGMVVLSSSYY